MSAEDRAQEAELRQWENINATRPGSAQVRFRPDELGYGPEFCCNDDCGAEMPVERRAWGFHRCVDCAAQAEILAKHGR